jgi:hypothetical protein
MYGFWWHKPFNVEHGTIVICPASKREEVLPKIDPDSRSERRIFTSESRAEILLVGVMRDRRDVSEYWVPSLFFYAIGAVFSAIHMAAWNGEFPSSTVQTLWRIFAATATGATIAIVPTTRATKRFILEGSFQGILTALAMLLLSIAYTVSRLGLIVLIFYCFSSMPAGVYETVDWTNYLPHFS